MFEFSFRPVSEEIHFEKMKQVLAVLFCLSVIVFTVSAVPNPKLKTCCRKYSVSVPSLKRIKDYYIQQNDGLCKIEAVVFKLKKRTVCSDPNNNEVKELLEELSKKEQRG
ncbi:C-C motif chemokine 17-like [Scyliorhinus canicula]|uniref:C-C motif chemokine 17-like n=1 Tax=Scyliorhinus canicula TaxID=7830 RepID=UPI0018F58BE7|nr:C-C motif chemokine 17-like [Scyliorhinus canicula]